MARVFWDGFDVQNTGTNEGLDPQYWFAAAGSRSFVANGRFSPSRALQVSNAGATQALQCYMVPTPLASFAFAVAFFSTVIHEAGVCMGIMAVGATATGTYDSHIGLVWNANGSISAVRRTGGTSTSFTVLATSAPGTLAVSTYAHFAISGVISDTIGEFKVVMNGNPIPLFDLTGIDTRNGASAVAASCILGFAGSTGGSVATASVFYDDFVHDDVKATIPERKVVVLYANADGATLNLTQSTGGTHFGVIDEAQVSQTDYLSGSTVGNFDLIDLTTLPYTPASIDGIAVRGYGAKTDAALRSVNYGLKSGATDSLGADEVLASTITQKWRGLITDPNTAAAWTKAAVDALQLKIRIAA